MKSLLEKLFALCYNYIEVILWIIVINKQNVALLILMDAVFYFLKRFEDLTYVSIDKMIT